MHFRGQMYMEVFFAVATDVQLNEKFFWLILNIVFIEQHERYKNEK